MSINQTVSYFKKTKLKYPTVDTGQYTDIWLTTNDNTTALIDYYQTQQTMFYKKTDKPYVITMTNDVYKALKQTL